MYFIKLYLCINIVIFLHFRFLYSLLCVGRTDMLVHVVNSSGHVLAIKDVLMQMDKGYQELTKPTHDFMIHNVYVSSSVRCSSIIGYINIILL